MKSVALVMLGDYDTVVTLERRVGRVYQGGGAPRSNRSGGDFAGNWVWSTSAVTSPNSKLTLWAFAMCVNFSAQQAGGEAKSSGKNPGWGDGEGGRH
jgi:hypothetical protein